MAKEKKPSDGVRLHDLLVAHDFSAMAEAALGYAQILAKLSAARITLVHANAANAQMDGELAAMRHAHIDSMDQLELIAQGVRQQGMTCTTICRAGNPSDVLVQVASELKPNLLIMGAVGHRRMMAAHLGSTAEFIMRSMPCPTLTIGPNAVLRGHHWHLKRLMYATSLPAHQGKALRVTESIAKLAGGDVEVIHVCHGKGRRHETPAECQREMEEIVRQLRAAGIHASSLLLEQPAAKGILDRANELQSGLIVFGLEHPAIEPGNVSLITDVVQAATCPVLTIPGPA